MIPSSSVYSWNSIACKTQIRTIHTVCIVCLPLGNCYSSTYSNNIHVKFTQQFHLIYITSQQTLLIKKNKEICFVIITLVGRIYPYFCLIIDYVISRVFHLTAVIINHISSITQHHQVNQDDIEWHNIPLIILPVINLAEHLLIVDNDLLLIIKQR